MSPVSSLTGMSLKLPESIARQKASEPERKAIQELQGRESSSIAGDNMGRRVVPVDGKTSKVACQMEGK